MVSATILSMGILLVARVEAEPAPVASDDLASYALASQSVGRDPAAHIRLALWCEAHGLQAERLKHLALAVLSDPANGTARGLMGLVAYGGHWKRPEAVAERVKADEDLSARLAEYNARRARTPQTADAQWALGLWCEQNGLNPEAQAHFTAVTRLDPTREAAWKRLDCKKVGGRWVSEAQLAAEKEESEAQKKADRHWKPLLTKWRGWLGDEKKRGEAERGLAEITDPRAVAAVWSVFVAGNATTHARAVRLLGQIDAPAASRALAFLSVFDDSAEVRRLATETLRQRDPREFAGRLVNLLRKPIKYEVRPVGGPGSPGVLFVEGERFNVERLYSPPPVFDLARPQFRGSAGFDANGMPVVTRRVEDSGTPYASAGIEPFNPAANQLAESLVRNPQAVPSLLQGYQAAIHAPAQPGHASTSQAAAAASAGNSRAQMAYEARTAFMIAQAQNMAGVAQQQLQNDIKVVDAYNTDANDINTRASNVLAAVAGKDLGSSPDAWQAWWVNQLGYASRPPTETPRPTILQEVPIDYQPVVPPGFRWSPSSGFLAISCFGAGTRVRTLDGSRPIEAIEVGDRVLTQDVRTGALGYHPVTVIHHNPPSPTFLVKLGGDTIVSSPFHRFWVAGQGWIMVRDLKGGEVLRLLDGPARVEAVEAGPVQPVYNLDVAEAHDFFAGAAAVLVHDNTLSETRLDPFDAPAKLAATGVAH